MSLSRIVGRAVAEIGIFSFVLNMLLLVQPIYLLQVYDRVLTSGSMDTLAYISLIAMAGIAVLGILESVRTIYAARVANRMDVALAGKALFASLYGAKAQAGEIPMIQDLNTVRGFINSRTLFFLFDLPFAPLFLVLLYFIHPVLFYLSLAGAAILVILMLANQYATRRQISAVNQSNLESLAAAQLFTRNAETVRALGMTFNVLEYWGGRMSEGVAENDAYQQINSWFAAASRFVRLALQIGILGAGAYLVIKGEMTGGMIFASSIISGRALQPLDQIIGAWRHVQSATTAMKRLMPLTKMRMDRADGDVLLPAPSGAITVDTLTYHLPAAAPGSSPVIKQMSFSIAAGECIGIVGPSGAGKSTLARLIAGALRPSHGAVYYDKADISQWLDADRGRHIGYLGQEIEFFPGTIAQNIARFDPGFDEADVMKAAERAGAHELIISRPRGYGAEIGPTGERLSAGERQRVGLARALYGAPRILILDEPNSNLDMEGQVALEQAVTSAKADGLTVILILHRGPMLKLCDRLMVIRAGAMEMFGPTEAVVEKLAAADPALQAQAARARAARERAMNEAPATAPQPPQGPVPGQRLPFSTGQSWRSSPRTPAQPAAKSKGAEGPAPAEDRT